MYYARHSHSILSIHRNALICKHKFFDTRSSTVRPIRQKIALLNSKENFRDLESARFQRLSPTIGRFFEFVEKGGHSTAQQRKTVTRFCLASRPQAPKAHRRVVAWSPAVAAAF
jgi:hypothetical protein